MAWVSASVGCTSLPTTLSSLCTLHLYLALGSLCGCLAGVERRGQHPAAAELKQREAAGWACGSFQEAGSVNLPLLLLSEFEAKAPHTSGAVTCSMQDRWTSLCGCDSYIQCSACGHSGTPVSSRHHGGASRRLRLPRGPQLQLQKVLRER